MPPIVLTDPIAKGLMFLTAHPAGCAALVQQQITRARAAFPAPLPDAAGRTALVIGSTTFGYGSSTLIALREAGFGKVIGIGYENPPQTKEGKDSGLVARSSSTGWYLTHTLHTAYPNQKTYLADAFQDATRQQVIKDLQAAGQKVDLVLYSLAAPTRSYNGQTWRSALKVIGEPLEATGVDFSSGQLKRVRVEPATPEEIENTRHVMGGEDLDLWVGALLASGLLSQGARVTALSYIGPESFTALRRLYWEGTIGAAKKHIDETTHRLNGKLSREIGGMALSVMNPAVVTVASAQIPAVVKYLSDYLGAVMGGLGVYDDPLNVAVRFVRALYGPLQLWRQMLDGEGRLRLDQEELNPSLQSVLQEVWKDSQPGELQGLVKEGFPRFKTLYRRLFGFDVPGVDYQQAYEFQPELTPEMGVINLLNPPPQQQRAGLVAAFFNALLSRDCESGVRKVQEGEKTVFVLDHPLDPGQIRRYAEVTHQSQDGIVPSAYTFVIAYPAILDAIKPILEAAKRKTVIHAAEEISVSGAIPMSGAVQIKVKVDNKKSQGEAAMVFISREIVSSEGEILATGKTTLVVGADPASIVKPVPAKPTDLEGELLSTITMTQEWINSYIGASGDSNPVHVSQEAAAELGLSSPIAHGVLTMGLANRDASLAYKATFKTPVQPGDLVEFRRSGRKIIGIKVSPAPERFVVIELTPKS